MKSHGFGDLAGFVENYFGEQIIISGEPKFVQKQVSSQELIQYAEQHLRFSNLCPAEKSILGQLIGEEKNRVHLIRNLLLNVTSNLKDKRRSSK